MVHNPVPSSPAPGVARDLEGRRVLVTGGSRGIGAAIVKRLTAAGADVLATARTAPATVQHGAFVVGDVATEQGARAVARQALERLGAVDVVIDNAGAARSFPAGALSIGPADWQSALDINYLAAVHLDAALLPGMLERGSGAIVHISSAAANTLPGALLHYGAAKAALNAYSKGLATELAPHGIRVNAITPGNVASPGADAIRDHLADAAGIDVADIHASIPIGRIGAPIDIAEAVAYLVSDRASYVTGANLVIDGGELTQRPS